MDPRRAARRKPRFDTPQPRAKCQQKTPANTPEIGISARLSVPIVMKGLHLDRYQALAGAQLVATSLKVRPVHRPRPQKCGHYSLATARQDDHHPHLLAMLGLISTDMFLPLCPSRLRTTSLAGLLYYRMQKCCKRVIPSVCWYSFHARLLRMQPPCRFRTDKLQILK